LAEEVKPRHGWCVALRSWAACTGLGALLLPGTVAPWPLVCWLLLTVRLDEFARRRLGGEDDRPASRPAAGPLQSVVLFARLAAVAVVAAGL
jgi:hypothetical protein